MPLDQSRTIKTLMGCHVRTIAPADGRILLREVGGSAKNSSFGKNLPMFSVWTVDCIQPEIIGLAASPTRRPTTKGDHDLSKT